MKVWSWLARIMDVFVSQRDCSAFFKYLFLRLAATLMRASPWEKVIRHSNEAAETRMPSNFKWNDKNYFRTKIASTSTCEPFGNAETCTAARAG